MKHRTNVTVAFAVVAVIFLIFGAILNYGVKSRIEREVKAGLSEEYDRGIADGVDMATEQYRDNYTQGYSVGLTEGVLRAEKLCNVKFDR